MLLKEISRLFGMQLPISLDFLGVAYQKVNFQVIIDMPYVNKDCFSIKKPVVVPALTLLSQLI